MKIVLWRMGSVEHNKYPSTQAVQKLANIIANMQESEINHIVWGPDLDVQIIDVEDLADLNQYILAYKGEENEKIAFDHCGVDGCACNS